MTALTQTVPSWTKYSPERRLLDTLVRGAGPFAGHRLDSLLSLFKTILHVDIEFEIREGYALLNHDAHSVACSIY